MNNAGSLIKEYSDEIRTLEKKNKKYNEKLK